MPNEVKFAGLMASLRAPRVAVIVPTNGWELHSQRAIESFSRTWGGAASVIIPTSEGGDVDPAVQRLLRRYDPDYVATLLFSLGDFEAMHPGRTRLDVDGNEVPADERAAFIERAEASGPRFMGPVVEDEVLHAIAASLPCFKDGDGRARVHWVHPAQEPPRPLVKVEIPPEHQVRLETGDALVDLALGMHNGFPDAPTETRRLSDKSLTRREVTDILTKDKTSVAAAPFQATRVGLTPITHGYVRNLRPVVVLGRSADDMALAMLWDRIVGSGIWLPFTGSHTRWHGDLGVGLDMARLEGDRKLLVTSVSLKEDQCHALMRKIWAARWLWDPSDASQPWDYISPGELDSQGRVDLRVTDMWDERFAAPVNVGEDGSSEMATTFPLVAPDNLPAGLSGWVVDAEWPEHPVHAHHSITGDSLVAGAQNPHETFVRAGGAGITFESSRWDWVSSGASRFGQLAQPKLRWPGLLNMLKLVAASTGYEVRASHAGKVGRIAADLWQGRDNLTEDLAGKHRQLLDAFVDNKKGNGPIEDGPDITPEDQRLMIHGACLVPFHALTRIAGSSMTPLEIRRWLDWRIETGAIRMGLILQCGVCPWVDFYRIEDFGIRFECKRCGSQNALTHERWRTPESAPRWYYDLHPTVREFIDQNGDVPVLAVRQFAWRQRATDIELELELVKVGADKLTTEIDFALMTREGLVLGEAKRPGRLDGKLEKDRIRDAGKLIEAARILAAREICFASATSWTPASLSAIQQAATNSSSQVTVSLLEKLAEETPTSRTVIHNPGGP